MRLPAKTEIIKSALLRARHTVTLKPERGQRTYRSVATIADGTACCATEGNQSFTIDVPASVGGTDAGPSPSVLLRAALSSCIAIGIKQWAALHEIDVTSVGVVLDMRVDARGQLGVSESAAPGFEDVGITIDLETNHAADAVEAMVSESLRYSPLIDMLKRPQTLDVAVKVKGREA